MSKLYLETSRLSVLALVILFLFPFAAFAAAPSISTSNTTDNLSATDDQDASTAITTNNVVEVKASRRLNVNALPGDNETITIGTCVITYASSSGSTNHELDCADNAAVIDLDIGAGNSAPSPGDIGDLMRSLTNLSDTGHGALTIGGSSIIVDFTTTGTEATSTAITFTDGTSGDITALDSPIIGVVPVAQVNTITISGTVEVDDVFTATLPTVGAVNYTVTASDTTTSDIASGLNTAIQGSSGYASQAFTSATSTNTVVLTAKVAGTGFTQTSSATNRSAVAQVTVFTPVNTESHYSYTININGTDYTYKIDSGSEVQGIVEGLQPLVNADSAVSCTEDNTAITCTAVSAGTSFTYSTRTSPSGSGSSGGYSVSTQAASASPDSSSQIADLLRRVVEALQAKLNDQQREKPSDSVSETTVATQFTRSLSLGTYGEDVRELQQLMNQDPETQIATSGEGSPGNETTYYGLLTEEAVKKFQDKHNIVTPESSGYGWFGPLTAAKLIEVLGL